MTNQITLDVFFIRLFDFTLPEEVVFCAALKATGVNIIYKKLTRRKK